MPSFSKLTPISLASAAERRLEIEASLAAIFGNPAAIPAGQQQDLYNRTLLYCLTASFPVTMFQGVQAPDYADPMQLYGRVMDNLSMHSVRSTPNNMRAALKAQAPDQGLLPYLSEALKHLEAESRTMLHPPALNDPDNIAAVLQRVADPVTRSALVLANHTSFASLLQAAQRLAEIAEQIKPTPSAASSFYADKRQKGKEKDSRGKSDKGPTDDRDCPLHGNGHSWADCKVWAGYMRYKDGLNGNGKKDYTRDTRGSSRDRRDGRDGRNDRSSPRDKQEWRRDKPDRDRAPDRTRPSADTFEAYAAFLREPEPHRSKDKPTGPPARDSKELATALGALERAQRENDLLTARLQQRAQDDEEDDDDRGGRHAYNLMAESGPKLISFHPTLVGPSGKSASPRVIIDCGAGPNFIHVDLAARLDLPLDTNTRIDVSTASGAVIRSIGRVSARYGSETVTFAVLEDLPVHALLGMEFLNDYIVDFTRKTMTHNGSGITTTLSGSGSAFLAKPPDIAQGSAGPPPHPGPLPLEACTSIMQDASMPAPDREKILRVISENADLFQYDPSSRLRIAPASFLVHPHGERTAGPPSHFPRLTLDEERAAASHQAFLLESGRARLATPPFEHVHTARMLEKPKAAGDTSPPSWRMVLWLYEWLNRETLPLVYNTTTVTIQLELAATLFLNAKKAGKRVYSTTLDLKECYEQVPLTEELQGLTTFQLSRKLPPLTCTTLPQGCTNATRICQRIMDMILKPLKQDCATRTDCCVINIMDDVGILSTSVDTHTAMLQSLLSRFRFFNAKFNGRKVKVMFDKLTMFGMIVEGTTIRHAVAPAETVASLPRPTSLKTLRSLMGSLAVLKRDTPKFTELMSVFSELHEQASRKLGLVRDLWDDKVHGTALRTITAALLDNPSRALHDRSAANIVFTDGSGGDKKSRGAWSGVLCQGDINDAKDGGARFSNLRVVAFTSGPWRTRPSGAPPPDSRERELSAMYEAVKSLTPFIDKELPLHLLTDHESLEGPLSAEFSASSLRKLDFLGRHHQACIRYIPRDLNPADYLSYATGDVGVLCASAESSHTAKGLAQAKLRLAHSEAAEAELGLLADTLSPSSALSTSAPATLAPPGTLTLEADNLPSMPPMASDELMNEFCKKQRSSAPLRFMLDEARLALLDPDSTPKKGDFRFETATGALCYMEPVEVHHGGPRAPRSVPLHRLVIPEEIADVMLYDAHTAAGHPGPAATLRATVGTYWLPDMSLRIHNIVSCCVACQAGKHSHSQSTGFRTSLEGQDYGSPDPWDTINVDVYGKVTPVNDACFILTVVCQQSGFLVWWAMPSQDTDDTLSALRLIYGILGTPKHVRADNGSNFRSKAFTDFHSGIGCTVHYTSSRHPQANAKAENVHRLLGVLMRDAARRGLDAGRKNNWPNELSSFALAHNSLASHAYDCTPGFLMSGRTLRLPGRLSAPSAPDHILRTPSVWNSATLALRELREERSKAATELFNSTRVLQYFRLNQLVRLLNPDRRASKTNADIYRLPYRIIAVKRGSLTSFDVEPAWTDGQSRSRGTIRATADQLAPFYAHPRASELSARGPKLAAGSARDLEPEEQQLDPLSVIRAAMPATREKPPGAIGAWPVAPGPPRVAAPAPALAGPLGAAEPQHGLARAQLAPLPPAQVAGAARPAHLRPIPRTASHGPYLMSRT